MNYVKEYSAHFGQWHEMRNVEQVDEKGTHYYFN